MQSVQRCLEGYKKIDLHIFLVPASSWRADLHYADRSAYVESTSAGFVRVEADTTLIELRAEITNQLDACSLPQAYIFLRSLGRCFTWIAPKQELFLKANLFLPPSTASPEIYLLDTKLLGDQYCIPSRNQEHLRRKQGTSDCCAQHYLTNKGEHRLRMRKLTVPPVGYYPGRESYRPRLSTVSLPLPMMGCVSTITISCMPEQEVGTPDGCTPLQSHSCYSRHSSSDSYSSCAVTPMSLLNKTHVSDGLCGDLDQLDDLSAGRGREKCGNGSLQRWQLHKQIAVSTPRTKSSAEPDPAMASGSVLQIETCYTDGLQKPVNPASPATPLPPPSAPAPSTPAPSTPAPPTPAPSAPAPSTPVPLSVEEETIAQVPPFIPGTLVTKASLISSDPAMASELQGSPSNDVDYAGDATQHLETRNEEKGHFMETPSKKKDSFISMHETQSPTDLFDALHSPLLVPEQRLPSDDSMQCRDAVSGIQPSKEHLEVISTAEGGNVSAKTATASDPLLASAKDSYNASHGGRLFPMANSNGSRTNVEFCDRIPAGSDLTTPTSRKVFHTSPYSPAVDGGVLDMATATPACCDESLGANAAKVSSYMDDLRKMKQECEELNAARTKMNLKMRRLQSLLQRKREEERWKKSYIVEKKRFGVLGEKVKELRGSLHALQKAAEEAESLRRVANGMMQDSAVNIPSEQSNIQIQCRRLKACIKQLQERLSSVKENVFKEQQVHKTLLLECKELRDELVAKKIAFTKVRTVAL